VYFNIYNQCYRRSFGAGDTVTRFQAMYLLSLSAAGWILFLQAIYLRTIKHSWFTTKSGAMFFALSVYLLAAMVFHRIFIINERDQQIFDKYAASWDSNPNKKRDVMISLFIIAIPYLLLGALKWLMPRT
jgi:hypothetical protein